MFHLELRQFPHVARAFNLTLEELDSRVLRRWVEGQVVELEDRGWTPQRAKLTIYEGPALGSEELGLGRGWSAAARSGENVTARLLVQARQRLAPPGTAELKRRLLELAAQRSLALGDVVELATASGRPSERLAAAEQAVWELLHEGRVLLLRDGTALGSEEWRQTLLSWSAWSDGGLVLAGGKRS